LAVDCVGGVADRLRGYEFEEAGDVTSVAAWLPFANGSQGEKPCPDKAATSRTKQRE